MDLPMTQTEVESNFLKPWSSANNNNEPRSGTVSSLSSTMDAVTESIPSPDIPDVNIKLETSQISGKDFKRLHSWPTPSAEDESITRFNQYSLREELGRGAFGLVRLAFNEDTKVMCAMKMLSKKQLLRKAGLRKPPPRGRNKPAATGELSAQAPTPLENLHTEIAILKKLDHPNIVKLLEVLDDANNEYICMVFELIEHGEVLTIPTDKPLEERKALQYFRDLVHGVEYLHHQKIVHRDIKPANLLLSDSDHLKICDFGVSREFSGEDALITNTAGTAAFQPPEAFYPEKGLCQGRPADIWAMGITLFCFLFGKCPWMHDLPTALQEKITNEPLVFPQCQDVSGGAKNCISRMLEKEPGQRITMGELKLDQWLTQSGALPMVDSQHNCDALIEVSEEDVRNSVTKITKMDTVILVQQILKNKSFARPFSRVSSAPLYM